jgi:tetratricopeptide (TPR) repeat protein
VAGRLREWLEDNPANAALTATLVDVLLLGDRADEALEVARKFEGTYAESMLRRIWLGRGQAARGEIDTALAEFDAILTERAVPDEVREQVREYLVDTLIEGERYDEALQRCERWLEDVDELGRREGLTLRIELLLHKARVLQITGRNKQYAEVMEVLLEYLPDNAGLLNDLGYTWVDLGVNLERATAMIRRAVAEQPWNAAFVDSLGWACYKVGDFENAHRHLARAARLRDGQDPVVYDHLADAAYRRGDRDAAREHWSKALSLWEALSERERARLADLAAAVRAKLAALERSEKPSVAPTAQEQEDEEERREEPS